MARWWVALTGLFLSVFVVVALSGPGRIDIVDGQTRYEVARSLVEHCDSVIRDSRIWFAVFPGRDGRAYCNYRLPQSLAGVAAILAADAWGPASEARRHFFFTLIGAVACGVLAVTYAAIFRQSGLRKDQALLWASGGIFCTPSWFYGTSTFDDILGAAAVVLAVSASMCWRGRHSLAGAIAGGVMAGLAFHCKQPLGLFVLPVLAASYDTASGLRKQWGRLALIVALCLSLAAACQAYELYKFPPSSTAAYSKKLAAYAPIWSHTPQIALLAMSFSLSAGVVFYNPAILLCWIGWQARWRDERLFCCSLAVAIAIFVLFISCLTFFKGDPAWGPRYLTPVFAVLWLFAPLGAQQARRWVTVAVLMLGVAIQVGALSIDPHRLYVERGLPSAFYIAQPTLYFHPSISHLLHRPREIVEAFQSRKQHAECFTPAPSLTFAFPVLDFVERGPQSVRKYQVLKGFRFWWSSYQALDRGSRPVDVAKTVALLALVAGVGLILLVWGAAQP